MEKFIQKKVPGGKLLQLELKNGRFYITGDFFCHPESAITSLEDILLEMLAKKANEGDLKNIFQNQDITIVGFGHADLFELYQLIT